jgi:hypothetical protein
MRYGNPAKYSPRCLSLVIRFPRGRLNGLGEISPDKSACSELCVNGDDRVYEDLVVRKQT